MTMPHRIQRKRSKGWRKPENTVIVDRTSRYGNPFGIGSYIYDDPAADKAEQVLIRDNAQAVEAYRRWLHDTPFGNRVLKDIKENLPGKNVCCWCGLDEPCHGDVILEEANRGE